MRSFRDLLDLFKPRAPEVNKHIRCTCGHKIFEGDWDSMMADAVKNFDDHIHCPKCQWPLYHHDWHVNEFFQDYNFMDVENK